MSKSQSHQSTLTSYKQRKWFIDMSKKTDKFPLSIIASESSSQLNPVGYTERQIVEKPKTEEEDRLMGVRTWEVALGPIKQAPMNMFISWMAGGSIGLFPLMFVAMLLFRPFQSLFQVNKAFESLEGQYTPLHKLLYILGNFVNLAIALYKCHSMGILPTYASDWLAFETPQIQLEHSLGGIAFSS